MSKKVELDLVKRTMARSLDVRQVAEILEEIQREAEKAAEAEGPKPPPVKKEFVILVSDPEGHLDGVDLTGWAVQVTEGESPAMVPEKIYKAAYDFNATPKGRRFPVETVGEACEAVAARFFKEHGLWVKTKEPVLVVRTDNKIPRE